jgi:hypothetical protein
VAPEVPALLLYSSCSGAGRDAGSAARCLLALLLASVIVLQGLLFEVLTLPHSFSWVPFMNSLSDSLRQLLVLLEAFPRSWVADAPGMALHRRR